MTGGLDVNALTFLAIDLGTQSLRISALESTGRRSWAWSRPVDSTIHGDLFEQRPRQWAAWLDEGLREAGRAGVRPDAVAVAAPLAGFVAMAADGEALTAAVLYPDKRSAPYLAAVEQAAERLDGSNPYGLRAYVPDPIPHYLRIRESEPDVYARMAHLLDATGWLNWFLTGQYTLNEYTALRLYDERLRSVLGVSAKAFGQAVKVGTVIGQLRADSCRRWGLPAAPVIAATIDSKTAYLGSGIAQPGDALDISGTVTSFGVVAGRCVVDEQKRVYSVPFGPDHYLLRGSTATAGGTLEWARKELFADEFESLDTLVAATAAHENNPIFLPYLSGERTPLWNPYAQGALLGLTLDMSSRARMARAVYEGLAYSLKHIVHTMDEVGVKVDRAVVSGGLARNDVLCQIKADVLGIPLTRLTDHELTTIGLCVIAGMALGVWPDRASALRTYAQAGRVFRADADAHAVHQRLFGRYLRYSRALRDTFVPVGLEGA